MSISAAIPIIVAIVLIVSSFLLFSRLKSPPGIRTLSHQISRNLVRRGSREEREDLGQALLNSDYDRIEKIIAEQLAEAQRQTFWPNIIVGILTNAVFFVLGIFASIWLSKPH